MVDQCRSIQRHPAKVVLIEEGKLRHRLREIAAERNRWGLQRLPRHQQAEHPHQVWALDFQFDATADGRRLKFLKVTERDR